MITEKESVLFLANHPNLLRIHTAIGRLQNERDNNLVIACDATFAGLARRAGLDVIAIDSPNKAHWTSGTTDNARVKLVRMFGNMTHAYDNALKGDELIDAMVSTLRGGNDLFMCPAGVANSKAKWRSGVGKLSLKIANDPVNVGFVYIPSSFFRDERIVYGPAIGTFIPDINIDPKTLALQLQEEYRRIFMTT